MYTPDSTTLPIILALLNQGKNGIMVTYNIKSWLQHREIIIDGYESYAYLFLAHLYRQVDIQHSKDSKLYTTFTKPALFQILLCSNRNQLCIN